MAANLSNAVILGEGRELSLLKLGKFALRLGEMRFRWVAE